MATNLDRLRETPAYALGVRLSELNRALTDTARAMRLGFEEAALTPPTEQQLEARSVARYAARVRREHRLGQQYVRRLTVELCQRTGVSRDVLADPLLASAHERAPRRRP